MACYSSLFIKTANGGAELLRIGHKEVEDRLLLIVRVHRGRKRGKEEGRQGGREGGRCHEEMGSEPPTLIQRNVTNCQIK